MDIHSLPPRQTRPGPVFARTSRPEEPSATVESSREAVQHSRLYRDEGVEEETTVAALNRFLGAVATSLRFEVDRGSATLFVKLVDNETGDIIREYPVAQLLAITHKIDSLSGALLREVA